MCVRVGVCHTETVAASGCVSFISSENPFRNCKFYQIKSHSVWGFFTHSPSRSFLFFPPIALSLLLSYLGLALNNVFCQFWFSCVRMKAIISRRTTQCHTFHSPLFTASISLSPTFLSGHSFAFRLFLSSKKWIECNCVIVLSPLHSFS